MSVDVTKDVYKRQGVNRAKEANQFGILMVTHYTRILKYIKPDIVHVFADGHFVKTGGPELADELEENGYDQYLSLIHI